MVIGRLGTVLVRYSIIEAHPTGEQQVDWLTDASRRQRGSAKRQLLAQQSLSEGFVDEKLARSTLL